MPVPALDAHGLLPVGTYDCTLQEIEASFCWNAHRLALINSLNDFIVQRWLPLNISAPFWIDGSFTRSKNLPEDIDLVADLSHLQFADAFPVFQLQFQRSQLKAQYNVDFWIRHPSLPNDLAQFFCYTGIKAGAELGLPPKHPKGILRVQL